MGLQQRDHTACKTVISVQPYRQCSETCSYLLGDNSMTSIIHNFEPLAQLRVNSVEWEWSVLQSRWATKVQVQSGWGQTICDEQAKFQANSLHYSKRQNTPTRAVPYVGLKLMGASAMARRYKSQVQPIKHKYYKYDTLKFCNRLFLKFLKFHVTYSSM